MGVIDEFFKPLKKKKKEEDEELFEYDEDSDHPIHEKYVKLGKKKKV